MKTPNDKKRPNFNSESLGRFQRSRERMYNGPRYALGAVSTLNVKRNHAKRRRTALMVSVAGSVRAYRRHHKLSSASLAA